MSHVVRAKRKQKVVTDDINESIEPATSDISEGVDVNPRVYMEYKYRLGEGDISDDGVNLTLSLPMKSLEAAEELLSKVGEFTPGESDEAQKWLSCFQNAREAYVPGNTFTNAMRRDGSEWRQDVEHEGKRMSLMAGNPLSTKSNGPISGEDAILKINSALDLGAVVRVPLWHSGIWVSIKAPSSTKLITVDRLIANEKIILGRQTNGMAFSNVSVYLRKTLIDLLLDCIIDTSVLEYTKGSLLEIIKVTDYHTLIWGLTCSIYQDGYQISQPCINDISKCNHVVEEKIAISKIAWIDNHALKNEHRDFMWNSLMNKQSKEAILEYQNSAPWNEIRSIPVTDKFTLQLSVPSLKDDLDGGMKWVDDIVKEVDKLFTDVSEDDDLRNVRISERARASTLRQYVSWMATCEVLEGEDDPEPVNITDRDTIAVACESMTSNLPACDKIFKEIGKYIDDSSIAVIGIPSYDCPKCGKNNSIKELTCPEIIPLAIDENFFILIRHWTLKVVNQRNTF